MQIGWQSWIQSPLKNQKSNQFSKELNKQFCHQIELNFNAWIFPSSKVLFKRFNGSQGRSVKFILLAKALLFGKSISRFSIVSLLVGPLVRVCLSFIVVLLYFALVRQQSWKILAYIQEAFLPFMAVFALILWLKIYNAIRTW